MARLSIFNILTGLGIFVAAIGRAGAQECQCSPGNQVVKYIVVEMPDPVPSATALESAPIPTPSPGVNTTSTFGPVTDPHIDIDNPLNLIPTANVSLYYGSTAPEEPGSIHMSLSMDTPAVVLEYVAAISHVDCSKDSLAVTFNNPVSFEKALREWKNLKSFVLITNHMGDCDAEFERGFFLATKVASGSSALTILVTAAKEELTHLAGAYYRPSHPCGFP
jgi:hypothetical protein